MKKPSALSYQRRNQLLLSAAAGFSLLAYVVAIHPTVELYLDNARQQQSLAQLQEAPQIIQELQQQTSKYTRLTHTFRADSTRQESYVLNQLTRACRTQGVTLAALLPSQEATHNGYRVETRVAKLRGNFQGLIQVVYALEYQTPIGRLSSVRYVVEEDRKQRKSFLYAYVYLQNISSQPDDAL